MCTLSWKIVPCVRTTGLIKFLISAWLVGLATTAASTSANAQCVTAGTTVTCTGTVSGSPTGFGDGTQTGLTIQVQPNASVSGTVDGLSAGANNIFLNTGMIQGTEDAPGQAQVIKANVPLSEMFGYATSMRGSTQGRANFSMEFKQYDEAPRSVSEEIISKNNGGKDKDK